MSQVNLLGWSWGTQYCGLFLMAQPEKTARYVTYAQMQRRSEQRREASPYCECGARTTHQGAPVGRNLSDELTVRFAGRGIGGARGIMHPHRGHASAEG